MEKGRMLMYVKNYYNYNLKIKCLFKKILKDKFIYLDTEFVILR